MMTQQAASSLYARFDDIDGNWLVLTKASIRAVHEFNDEVVRVVYVAGQEGREVKVRGKVVDVLREAGFEVPLSDEVPDLSIGLTRLKALNQDGKVFVVMDYDDHADPDFHVFFNKGAAIEKARKCVDEHKQRYDGMASYPTQCDGRYGIWFSESGADRWRVQVHEAKIR